jgi:hypothetical protein
VTSRDRIVVIVVGAVAALAAFWFMALAPKRDEAKAIRDKVAVEQTRLQTAQQAADAAEGARRRYDSDYATVARLGKAVPSDDETSTLVYQLETAARRAHVDFRSIKLESTGTPTQTNSTPPAQAAAVNATEKDAAPAADPNAAAAAAAATSASAATLPPGASVGPAGFPTMPFSFDFDGKFFPLQRFLRSLDDLTTVNGKSISVKGRLLTVDGVALKAGPKGFPDVSATVAVTAYLLPADEGLTAGATATTTPAATTSTGAAPTASLIGSDR